MFGLDKPLKLDALEPESQICQGSRKLACGSLFPGRERRHPVLSSGVMLTLPADGKVNISQRAATLASFAIFS
jgi:hypothetical protein